MLTYVTVTDSSGHRTELPFSSSDSALAYAMDIMEHNDAIVQAEVHDTPAPGTTSPGPWVTACASSATVATTRAASSVSARTCKR